VVCAWGEVRRRRAAARARAEQAQRTRPLIAAELAAQAEQRRAAPREQAARRLSAPTLRDVGATARCARPSAATPRPARRGGGGVADRAAPRGARRRAAGRAPAELEGELAAERRQGERRERERAERERIERLRSQHALDSSRSRRAPSGWRLMLEASAATAADACRSSSGAAADRGRRGAGASCARAPPRRPRCERVLRAARPRREQLGPVNPLAQEEYARRSRTSRSSSPAHRPRDGAARAERADPRHRPPDPRDLRADLRGGRANFEELVGDVFPGGSRAAAAGEPRRAGAARGARRPAARGRGRDERGRPSRRRRIAGGAELADGERICSASRSRSRRPASR
jgi:hypothetical protein